MGCGSEVLKQALTNDSRMRADQRSLDRDLDRARALADAGRRDEAQAAYLAVIGRDPDHVRALTDFGAFLVRGGMRGAARTVLERAVALRPDSALARANLAHVLFAETDYEAAREQYEAALAIEPERPEAHQGLSYALTRLGREEEALEHRRQGFAGRALMTGAYTGEGDPVDVLLIVSAAGGTLYTETFLDEQTFRTTTLVADYYAGEEPLPPVDVVFNAISDADRNRDLLAAVAELVDGSSLPLINDPRRVLATGRVDLSTRLAQIDGVIAPRTVSVPLDWLRRNGPDLVDRAGFAYPLLVRAPGFHTGRHFVRIESRGMLLPHLATFPPGDVLLMEFVDVRNDDARVRKYRMMSIAGEFYPLHVAISGDWKVHYFTADMAGNAANRAEDERFLADPYAVLGGDAMAALARVRDAVGLDYMGIDFGLAPDGRVVVFEANATMIVLPPAAGPIWDYRRAPVARIIAAVRTMLLARQ